MFIVFPGQGSQKMHMGRAYAENADIMKYIQLASKITNKDIKHLVMDAESEELNRTENAQLAIFVMTYALFKLFEPTLGQINAFAGHSLGEYIALAASRVLSFEDACLLIKERSDLMKQVHGKMMAVLNISPIEANMISLLATENEEACYVANYNSTTQIVLSGNENAIVRAQEIASKFGKRGVLLPVSGPFHSPYMKDACDKLLPVIDKLQLNEPKVPVISNIYATPVTHWKSVIGCHMRAPVRWQETLETMKKMDETAEFIEIGATTLLTSMAKRDGYNIKYI